MKKLLQIVAVVGYFGTPFLMIGTLGLSSALANNIAFVAEVYGYASFIAAIIGSAGIASAGAIGIWAFFKKHGKRAVINY